MNPFLDWDRVTFSHGVWLENYVVLLRKYSIEMNCPFSVIFAADSGMWQMGVSIIWSGAIHNTAVPIQGRLIQTMNSKMNEILQQVVFFFTRYPKRVLLDDGSQWQMWGRGALKHNQGWLLRIGWGSLGQSLWGMSATPRSYVWRAWKTSVRTWRTSNWTRSVGLSN